MHLAIILDGNRRFAKRLMLEPWKGHEFGRKKVEDLLTWCTEAGINELTLYTFSMQNFNRPKEEFDYLMKIFKDTFTEFAEDKRLEENGIRINILGRYKLFPPEVVAALEKIMEKTKNHNKYILNFAMAYGGREELVDAIKKIVSEHPNPESITEDYIGKHLYSNSAPDIVIRTGGDKRTSNFLIWQSNYSEWFFLEKTWPEFEKQDLMNVLEEFKQRERRFGK